MINSKLILTASEKFAPGATLWPVPVEAPFKMTTFEVEPNCETPLDQHKVEEIWVVQSGMGELTVADEVFQIREGDIFNFKSYVCHQVRNLSATNLKILSIYW